MMTLFLSKLRFALLPISILYGLVVWLRGLFFDWGWLKSHQFDQAVISVGNITVGGTGKTPHVEYLISLLRKNYRLGLVSRGYRRRTKGVVVADANATAESIGDEPMQICQKFTDLTVVVAEKRVDGINACLSRYPKPEVVLLDDAFQHRYVQAGLSIVLIDYNRPVWNDWVFPAGNLREGRWALKRADIVVVTKCPVSLSPSDANVIKDNLKLAPTQKLYFSSFKYGKTVSLSAGMISDVLSSGNCGILAFTAIAKAAPLHLYLRGTCAAFSAIELPDHHWFTPSDLDDLVRRFAAMDCSDKWIVVTEKDAVKLREMGGIPKEIARFIQVLPIEPVFLFSQQQEFNNQIIGYVAKG